MVRNLPTRVPPTPASSLSADERYSMAAFVGGLERCSAVQTFGKSCTSTAASDPTVVCIGSMSIA